MTITLDVRNESARRAPCRRDMLKRLAARVLAGEGVAGDVEVSVLFCDDPFIASLNREYRNKRGPTDVLSFTQDNSGTPEGGLTLGDIVISLETVERFRNGDKAGMRDEVRLLFCHGLLHLLGHDHGNAAERRLMQGKQAEYLGASLEEAWHSKKGGC